MTERDAWIIIGALLYFAGYLTISTAVTIIWGNWARKKTNVFYRYNLQYELKRLYPRAYEFMADYHWLYNIMYVVLWPVVIPAQFTMCTRAVNESLYRRHTAFNRIY